MECRYLLANRSKIIAVETQATLLRDLETQLTPFHQVIGTVFLERALPLLRAERDAVAILVSTSKGADVLSVLEAARQERHHVLRVLITAFEDLTLVVEGLHSGAVQRVVSRPIAYEELLGAIRPATDPGFAARGVRTAS
jgi:DNA-binding NtrC family response regulator